jgi:ATP-binding cassette subfamily B protein
VVLRDGRIIERGTHDELLAREGYYADLYRKQLLEEELENA